MSLNKTDKERLAESVESEGFDYTFVHYSNWSEVKDEEFHKLRKEYLAASKKLAQYIGVEDDI